MTLEIDIMVGMTDETLRDNLDDQASTKGKD